MHLALYKQQAGVVLVVVLILLIFSMGIFFITHISSNKHTMNKQQKTRHALAQAKQALIAYAVSYYENSIEKQYALLPCPELSGSSADGRQQTGACRARNVNVVGRLPWFTLKIPALVDGDGECLWYAVSGGYKFAASGKSKMLNDDTPGMFQLVDTAGNLLAGDKPEDRIVALVISPGHPLAYQNRDAANSDLFCRVSHSMVNINNYLDKVNDINNADVSNNEDVIDTFVTALDYHNENVNDQILAIYQSDIFQAITANQAFTKKMDNLSHILSACIGRYGRMQACVSGRQCESLCDDGFTLCTHAAVGLSDAEKICRQERAVCLYENNCDALCDFSSSGYQAISDTSITQMNLPLPALMNINVDYRLNENYKDLTMEQANDPNIGLLGRYMFDVSNSINNPAVNNIFEACGAMSIASISPNIINMVDENDQYRKLWQHWKDHFFYVVGRDMTALHPSTFSCSGNCPVLDNNSQAQAAMLWFSSERLQNQYRQSKPPEPAAYNIPNGFSKASINNYLELTNTHAYPDINGNGRYQKALHANDIFYCIDENMVVSQCP